MKKRTSILGLGLLIAGLALNATAFSIYLTSDGLNIDADNDPATGIDGKEQATRAPLDFGSVPKNPDADDIENLATTGRRRI